MVPASSPSGRGNGFLTFPPPLQRDQFPPPPRFRFRP